LGLAIEKKTQFPVEEEKRTSNSPPGGLYAMISS
jgi:hypothetical protein